MDGASTRTLTTEAISFATRHGWTDTPLYACAFLARGWAAHQWLDDATAAEASVAMRPLAYQSQDVNAALAVQIFDVITAFERTEDRHSLVATLRHAWQQHGLTGHTPPALAAASALVEQQMSLQVGEPGWAREVLERTEQLLGLTGELHVLQAVGQVHRGRTEAAVRLLAPVLSGEVGCVVPVPQMEAWIWEARLADRAQQEERAHAALVQALTIGAAHEVLRPFVSSRPEVHDLLARGAGRFGRLEPVAARVRTALPPADHGKLDLLTTRELQLLVELPSLRTADEIATSLFVSVNTVKTHLRGIYRKLGVNSRREAILLARRRGLL